MDTTDAHREHEIRRRRTFAIISHPDAGKTTLTEKVLLYGGCVEVAGAVRGRKTQRTARSDWMELEKQRGISVNSTVLVFDYDGHRVNLLDTPGHHDFSEDTYRTLMAADCAVMVIDLAKGIETQTEKLFKVCALRGLPVITFVNKVDRPGREPLAILSEIEEKFGIAAVPANWPIGGGQDFVGVLDLVAGEAHLFEGRRGDRRSQAERLGLADLAALSPQGALACEEAELLAAAAPPFDRDAFLAGRQSPVFFGSALTNYGVEQFLRGFLALCPPPSPRRAQAGAVPVASPEFAGLVFKIQANLDPRHRDRIAFVRICSGTFRRDMEVLHVRTGRTIRLRRAHRVFGQERETVEEAYPGDIVGLVNPGEFRLGDTICTGPPVMFEPLPTFAPEQFAILRCPDTGRRKQFERGLAQLLEEGVVQLFHDPSATVREPILGGVGELQFDVVRFRMENEYGTPTALQWLPYKLARWVVGGRERLPDVRIMSTAKLVHDQDANPVMLFQSTWDADYMAREYKDLAFSVVNTPPERSATPAAAR
jgi:peptide chain release factor 3